MAEPLSIPAHGSYAKLRQQLAQHEAELAGLSGKLEMQAIYELVGDKLCEIFNAQA